VSATPAQEAYDSILQPLRRQGKTVDRGINNAYSECPNHNEPVELHLQIKNGKQVAMGCNKSCAPSKVMTALGLNEYRAASTSGQSDPGTPGEQSRFIDMLANDEYRKMKARELAKQRLVQESAVGITLPEFHQLDEFLAQPDTETPYLVNGIWPKGGHILIVAQQKAGKTTLRNNLAKSLCDGYDFLNQFQVFEPEGRIVILDLELPENMLRRWMRDVGIRNQQQLVVVPMRGKAASLNIGLPEVRAKWAQKLKPLGRILRDPGLPTARAGGAQHV
jgi:hypothetical protein